MIGGVGIPARQIVVGQECPAGMLGSKASLLCPANRLIAAAPCPNLQSRPKTKMLEAPVNGVDPVHWASFVLGY